MKTHVIVQSLSVCLLLSWTVWDISATDAGGPPIRLAVARQVAQDDGRSEEKSSVSARLIPTEWDRTPELIPTDIDQPRVQWVRRDVDTFELIDDLFRWRGPFKYDYFYHSSNGFLDEQISTSPLRPVEPLFRDDNLTNIAPWLIGQRPTESMLGIKTVISFDPTQLGRTKGPPDFEVEDHGIPAEEWWLRLTARQKWNY